WHQSAPKSQCERAGHLEPKLHVITPGNQGIDANFGSRESGPNRTNFGLTISTSLITLVTARKHDNQGILEGINLSVQAEMGLRLLAAKGIASDSPSSGAPASRGPANPRRAMVYSRRCRCLSLHSQQ